MFENRTHLMDILCYYVFVFISYSHIYKVCSIFEHIYLTYLRGLMSPAQNATPRYIQRAMLRCATLHYTT